MRPENPKRPLSRLRPIRLLKTTGFRFAILNTVLFVLAVAALGGFVYVQTFEQELRRIDRQLSEELDLFDQTFRNASLAGLRRIIRGRINYRDSSLYILMIPPHFVTLEGNLSKIPLEARDATAAFQFQYEKEKYTDRAPLASPVVENRPALGRVARLTDPQSGQVSAILLVARDIEYLVKFRNSAQKLTFRLVFIVLFFGLGIGFFSARSLLGRVDNINRTAAAIRQGDLTNRIPLRGSDDEFDELALNLNEMLAQIEKLMSGMREVSDNIAHDLRSPLTRIRNKIEQAIKSSADQDSGILTALSADIDHLLATFNALLSITRIESGEGRGVLRKIDMHNIVEELADLYGPAIQEAGGKLITDIVPVRQIQASRELISQALSNLLDNAMKYSRMEGNGDGEGEIPCHQGGLMIELKLTQNDVGDVFLSVRDNGPGVPMVDRDRVFDRFVRLENSRSSSGNGLGLSLVAAIVRAHGAQIEVNEGLAWSASSPKSAPDTPARFLTRWNPVNRKRETTEYLNARDKSQERSPDGSARSAIALMDNDDDAVRGAQTQVPCGFGVQITFPGTAP